MVIKHFLEYCPKIYINIKQCCYKQPKSMTFDFNESSSGNYPVIKRSC